MINIDSFLGLVVAMFIVVLYFGFFVVCCVIPLVSASSIPDCTKKEYLLFFFVSICCIATVCIALPKLATNTFPKEDEYVLADTAYSIRDIYQYDNGTYIKESDDYYYYIYYSGGEYKEKKVNKSQVIFAYVYTKEDVHVEWYKSLSSTWLFYDEKDICKIYDLRRSI